MRPYSRIMRMPRWKDLDTPHRLDLLIAAGLLGWGLPDVPWWWEYPGHAGSTPDVLGSLALTFAMSVPFCWRREAPVPVLGMAVAVLSVRFALHRDMVSAFAAVLVGAYGLGAYAGATRRYARWLGWLTLAVALVAVTFSHGDRLVAVPFALLAAALVLGDAASARRAEAAAAVETAHQAERTRIARELHDVVAHQLSAIAVQAGSARMAADRAEQGGRETSAQVLVTVEQLAREALTELNHLLGALRREPADDLTRPPAPTLAELEPLLATARVAGVPVTLSVEGAPRALSPGIELSSYRIIAEALTNVTRHAPAAPTRVLLRYQADTLGIEVASGPSPLPHRPGAPRPGSGGRGVRGMRERAELYGGCLVTRASPDGGFTVAAEIPCPCAATGQGTGTSQGTGANPQAAAVPAQERI